MAGNARYTAVLDACVLYQLAIADSLMSIAVTGLQQNGLQKLKKSGFAR
jgi:hypothetical protein